MTLDAHRILVIERLRPQRAQKLPLEFVRSPIGQEEMKADSFSIKMNYLQASQW